MNKRVVNTDYVPYRNAAQAIREWAEGRPCGNPAHAQMLADWLHDLADETKREAQNTSPDSAGTGG